MVSSQHIVQVTVLRLPFLKLSMTDEGKFSVLVLLDLCAAFDTVDHDILLYILLHRLHHVFGIQGTALTWFRSYLKNRFQMVSIQSILSDSVELCYDVPQGLSLDLSFLFSIYSPSLMSFLTIQHLACCLLMTCRYLFPVTLMIWFRPFFV